MGLTIQKSLRRRGLNLPKPPWIVAHRGASGVAPENTLASVEVALAEGADLIEVDLHMTRDRHLVASHDPELSRRAGQPGLISELTLEQLARYDVGGPDAREGQTQRIPTLAQVLATLPEAFPVNLEIKSPTNDHSILIASLLGEIGFRSNILVSSFDLGLLTKLRKHHPNLPIAPITEQDTDSLLTAGRELNAATLHCHYKIVDESLIERAALDGRPVLVYTVNRAAEAEPLILLGVSGLFTDYPGKLRAELGLFA